MLKLYSQDTILYIIQSSYCVPAVILVLYLEHLKKYKVSQIFAACTVAWLMFVAFFVRDKIIYHAHGIWGNAQKDEFLSVFFYSALLGVGLILSASIFRAAHKEKA